MSNSLDRLERKLGYTFKDRDLMVLALTHRSYAGRNNERLEFLGDAILNFVIGEALFHHFPQAREGQLSRLRARLVKGETLALLARGFEVGDYLRLGSGELKSGGFRRESILADAMEALIGAIYLDTGMDSARERIIAWLGPQLRELTPVDTNKDPKTRLQEFLQSRAATALRGGGYPGRTPLPDLLRRLRSGPAERQDPRARRQPPHRRAGGRGRRAGGSGRGEWP